MRTYVFQYRRLGQFFWRKSKVIGHGLSRDPTGLSIDLEKMVLYFEDGSMREICCWSKCESRVGPDFIASQKAEMEKSTGQSIPLNINQK